MLFDHGVAGGEQPFLKRAELAAVGRAGEHGGEFAFSRRQPDGCVEADAVAHLRLQVHQGDRFAGGSVRRRGGGLEKRILRFAGAGGDEQGCAGEQRARDDVCHACPAHSAYNP